MGRRVTWALLAGCLAVGHGGAQAQQPARGPTVQTLASYPHGTFLENLVVARDGSAVVTSYLDRRLLRGEDGRFDVLSTLPAHPVGILQRRGGYVVTAHGTPFTNGPAFTSTNQILLLDRAGRVERTFEAPQARFLNGMVQVGGQILIADSIAGVIWSLDPRSGGLAPWLQHESLAPGPTAAGRPGANGLKVRDGRLYVSNSGRGTIQTVRLTRRGSPAGAPQPFFSGSPIDDFTFGRDGAIYAATHGQTLLRIDEQGRGAPVLSEGCDSCTSAAFSGDDLLVLTTGDLVENGAKPARILRLDLKGAR